MMAARIAAMHGGRFQVTGELCFDTVPELLSQARGLFMEHPRLEIDLQGVSRVDSSAVALLIEWLGVSRRDGQTLTYLNVPSALLDLARASGVCDLLPLRLDAAA